MKVGSSDLLPAALHNVIKHQTDHSAQRVELHHEIQVGHDYFLFMFLADTYADPILGPVIPVLDFL